MSMEKLKSRLAKVEAIQDYRQTRPKFIFIKAAGWPDEDIVGYNDRLPGPDQTLDELAEQLYAEQENDCVLLFPMYKEEVPHERQT